ncbi:MAG: phosphatase [Bacteroidia bacterium]|nr:phosphatase [Bacteroidia bacterium]MCF8425678.1 phosphatase [Bacteroidia bacterium]MCF8447271.1 phosphatase [Bacteroidia bacterium]
MKLAAIDIGSNAVRLQIVRTNDNPQEGTFKKIEFVRIPVRLGDDAFKEKWISKEKRKIFYKAMAAFKLMLDAFEVDYYMACATSAMREAKNGEKIVKKIEKEFGLKIQIIDGKRESELILGSIGDVFEPNKNYLTIDVGGGSTEMTVISNRKVLNSVSFDIGTVRLMDGAVKGKTWETIESWVKHKTDGLENIEAVATSGTINKILAILNTEGKPIITRDQLKDFHRKVSKMSLQERMELYKLNPDRADIIDVSADIYLRILNWGQIETIFSPDNTGLKDGILNELYNKYAL